MSKLTQDQLQILKDEIENDPLAIYPSLSSSINPDALRSNNAEIAKALNEYNRPGKVLSTEIEMWMMRNPAKRIDLEDHYKNDQNPSRTRGICWTLLNLHSISVNEFTYVEALDQATALKSITLLSQDEYDELLAFGANKATRAQELLNLDDLVVTIQHIADARGLI